MGAQLKHKSVRRSPMQDATLGRSLVALGLFFGCAQSSGTGGSVERSVAGDTTFVRNLAPVFADTAHLTEVSTIGLLEGPEEYTFAHINSFTVGAGSDVFIGEVGGPLRQYDSTGEFVRQVGRQGEGPGEVRYVVGLAVLPSGTLVARDLGNGRFSLYDPDGEFTSQWTNSDGQPGYGRDAVTVDSSGAIYIGINPRLSPDDTPLAFPRPIYAKLAATGQVLDTLFAHERFTESCNVHSRRWFRRGWFEDVRVLYQPKVKWSITPVGSLVVGCPADYAFDIIEPSGSVLRVSRDWVPIRVSAEELDSFRDGITISSNQSGYFDAWDWRGPDMPGVKPAYQRFIPAEDGRIWVWPGQASEMIETPEPARLAGFPNHAWQDPMTGAFDVFEADGRFVGSVKLPKNLPYSFSPATPDPHIRGDTLWAVTVDSMDVQYLTRFEVRWPSK